MRWLRTERDLIGLVAVWGMLLQALIVPFSTGAHAAHLTDADFALVCSTGSATSSPVPGFAQESQKQSRSGADCQCCHMACHAGCGGACGGLLPSFARAVLPGDGLAVERLPRADAQETNEPVRAEAQPRAPPLSFS